MNIIDELGFRHMIKSSCRLYQSDFDGQIIDINKSCIFRKLRDGTVPLYEIEKLKKLNLLEGRDHSIYFNTSLCESIFGWNNTDEINFILEKFKEKERVIDVGCGWGRNLLPLVDRGLNVDGFDSSDALIFDLSKKIKSNSRVFVSELSTFCSPLAYGGAFASMNTLRYANGAKDLKAHFSNMKINLIKNSHYLICINISPSEISNYKLNWEFIHKGLDYEASWELNSVDYSRNEIFETVRIKCLSTGAVHTETQKQLIILKDTLSSIFKSIGGMEVVNIYNTHYENINSKKISTHGSYWIEVFFN